jgi:NADH pyrophosphatase NudC (nudix superfamily)
MSKFTDPLPRPEFFCPKCGAKKQPLSSGISHECKEKNRDPR